MGFVTNRTWFRQSWRGWISLAIIWVCVNSLFAASNEPGTVVVLGDSLAAGYGLDPTESYPAVLQKTIREAGWNFNVGNAGVSGGTSAGGVRRGGERLRTRRGGAVVCLGGGRRGERGP